MPLHNAIITAIADAWSFTLRERVNRDQRG
jgi:hypothetical protein